MTKTIPAFGPLIVLLSIQINVAAAFETRQTWWGLSSLPPSSCNHNTLTTPQASANTYFDANGDNPEYREEGERLIRTAATEAGAQPENIDVQWAGGRIVVTISGDLIPLGGSPDDIDDEEELDLYFDADELDDKGGIFGDVDVGDYVEDEMELELEDGGASITSIARAINRALAEAGEGSIGDRIATVHEIEVTTPGASDVLQGDVMFDAYKGFDVIVETNEVKKGGKKRILEGKLVERNDEATVVNVKGRITKVKNEKVESVRLPKAKKEKGVK